MKMKSIFVSLLFSATAFALFSGCSGNRKEEATSHTEHGDVSETGTPGAAAPQFDVPQDFQQQLGDVFTAYVSLKDALVSSNPEKVTSEAAATSQAVSKVDMKLLSGQAHNDWMTYLTPINNSLKDISGSFELETQRKAFSILSDNLYKSIKAFGLGGKEAFYEYCPMAFNNEGGYWLSDEEKIRNPYFGDEMLTCGEVKEKLR